MTILQTIRLLTVHGMDAKRGLGCVIAEAPAFPSTPPDRIVFRAHNGLISRKAVYHWLGY